MIMPGMEGAGIESGLPLLSWAGLALVPAVVLGIHWMRSPETAVRGNRLSMLAMGGFVVLVLLARGWRDMAGAWIGWGLVGGLAGAGLAVRVRMIRMPELIALFNGIGGASSALVALVALMPMPEASGIRVRAAVLLAACIGTLTFSGSAVAVLKLSRMLNPAPVRFPGQKALRTALLLVLLASVVAGLASAVPGQVRVAAWLVVGLGLGLGVVAMLRVGGADMPVSISLLNALSGVAAAVAGYVMGNPVPVAVGAVVGAGGLMLTLLMCRAMNRRLGDVLGGDSVNSGVDVSVFGLPGLEEASRSALEPESDMRIQPDPAKNLDPVGLLEQAKRVVIIPGYGMALAQAQRPVRRLFDVLEKRGVSVCFAVHPVAGRMPGHMHVLLAEVDLPYALFRELDDMNPDFPGMDVAIIVGANDVVNPAASTAKGTPIYGMPVLRVEEARAVIVCNLDDKPGYAGVPNPLFFMPHAVLCLGDAGETITRFADALERPVA